MPNIQAPVTLGAFPSETKEKVWIFPFGLTWDRAILDASNLNYDIHVDTSPTFTSVNARRLTKTSNGINAFQEGDGVGKAFEIELPGKALSAVTWYWRVRINQGAYLSPWSDVRTLTVPTRDSIAQASEIFARVADENSYSKEGKSSNVYKLLYLVGRELDLLQAESNQSVKDLVLDGARDTAVVNNFSKFLALDRSAQDVAAHHRWKTTKLWKAFTNIPGTQQGLEDAVVAFLAEPPTLLDYTTTDGWILDQNYIGDPDHPEITPPIIIYDAPMHGNAFKLVIYNSWDLTYDQNVLEYYLKRMKPAHSRMTLTYATVRRWALRFDRQADWDLWTNSGTIDTSSYPGTIRLNSGQTSGTLTSPVQRVAGVNGWDAPFFVKTTSGQTVTVEARTSADGSSFGSWVALNHGVTPGTELTIRDYIQFRATLSRTSAGAPNPILIKIDFNGTRS